MKEPKSDLSIADPILLQKIHELVHDISVFIISVTDELSCEPVHQQSLVRVFAVRKLKA